MEHKSERLFPSAPLEKIIDLEQRLENELNDFGSFSNLTNEMTVYFRDKNHKSKKRYKKYKTLTSILESVDTIIFLGQPQRL